jgi:hypothetical protein
MNYDLAKPPKVQPETAGSFAEECFFGSPSTPGRLQLLLADSIDRVPVGGKILWSTYYLANTDLLDKLRLAALRGVKVVVALEARPRSPTINREAFKRLGSLPGLTLVAVRSHIFSHLHEKLYYFSHPQPFFLAGSYNPSMDAGLNPEVIEDIGDQDQGHNVLVKVTNPQAVERVRRHLHAYSEDKEAAQAQVQSDPAIVFLPMGGKAPHLHWFAQEWQEIHIAMSHLRDGTVVKMLARQAQRGCKVHLISHDSQRRFPSRHEDALQAAGVCVWRYCHPQRFPMHSKYTLLRNGSQHISLYGSMNFSKTSRWLNREVIVQSCAMRTYDKLLANWNDIQQEVAHDYR